MAFISGVPITLRIRTNTVPCSEINFMCVHKKLRSKRLAPVLIREITRRCNRVGIWQAIYTGGVLLPTPVATCRYFHRSLDWVKLNECEFSPLPRGSTKQRQIAKYKLPERTATKGLREMRKSDVPAVQELLEKYLARTKIAQSFDEREVEHWLLNTDTKSDDKVIWTYVVEEADAGSSENGDGVENGTQTGNNKEKKIITDFFSFYSLESTVIGNDKHSTIRAAYLFYYATTSAFPSSSSPSFPAPPTNTVAHKTRLNALQSDLLILAKQQNFDVVNALSLLDNPLFLAEQKFGPGDGRLHYYLYNWRTERLRGGVDGGMRLATTAEGEAGGEEGFGDVGVVML